MTVKEFLKPLDYGKVNFYEYKYVPNLSDYLWCLCGGNYSKSADKYDNREIKSWHVDVNQHYVKVFLKDVKVEDK